MSPEPQAIAHYRITAKLGEGGMGEVWRATDGKLGCEEVKILPAGLAKCALIDDLSSQRVVRD